MAARHKQIADALVALLEGIRAGVVPTYSPPVSGAVAYNLTPARVFRVHAFADDAIFDRSLGENVYFVRVARQNFFEESTGTILGKMEVGIVVASQFKNPTEVPSFEEVQTRAITLDLMIEDVTNALFSDVSLGGLAINVIDNEAEGLAWDRERWMAGWALAEASLSVSFSVVKGQV